MGTFTTPRSWIALCISPTLAINAVMFYYTLNQNAFIEAEQSRCADIQDLMTLMSATNEHIF